MTRYPVSHVRVRCAGCDGVFPDVDVWEAHECYPESVRVDGPLLADEIDTSWDWEEV